MNGKYDEIMGLPHHVSKTRPQMPMSDRAAQFAPFAALTGYDSAIKETGRLTDERIELDEGALTALNMRYQLLMDALDEEPENFKSGGYLRSVFIQLPDSVKKSAYITQKPSQTGCYKASDRIRLLP